MSEKPTSDRREFLRQAGVFAVTVSIPPAFWGCTKKTPDAGDSGEGTGGGTAGGAATEWATKVADLEKAGVFTTAEPGKWEGKAGSHVPQVTLNEGEGTIEVFTDHGMSEEHWITAQYLKDQDGKVIGFQAYEGTDEEARHTFEIPEGTTTVTAFSHCNKHDDWSADQVKAS